MKQCQQQAKQSKQPQDIPQDDPNTPIEQDDGIGQYGDMRPFKDIFRMADRVTPRVGTTWLDTGIILEKIQQLYPDYAIRKVATCRGVNRLRDPGNMVMENQGEWRTTIIMRRDNGQIAVEHE